MIAFDNGPKHGDYVRYIDDLMRVAAAATATNTATSMQSAIPSSTAVERESMSRLRERIAERASAQSDGPRFPAAAVRTASGASSPTVRTAASGAGTPPAGDTGFVDPTPASNAAARAAAIASALMSGEVARRSAAGRDTLVSVAAIVFGLLLIIGGIAWPATSLVVLLAGGAVLAWGGRRLRDAARRGSIVSGTSPGSTGA